MWVVKHFYFLRSIYTCRMALHEPNV